MAKEVITKIPGLRNPNVLLKAEPELPLSQPDFLQPQGIGDH